MVKIIGYGSLLSDVSARSTFGAALSNFRLARVNNFRRVFALPGSIFFRHGIANMATKEIGGLMVEPSAGSSFIVSVFDIPEEQLDSFYKRESLYKIASVPYEENDGTIDSALMCLASNDEELIANKGQAFFDDNYRAFGLHTVWGWDPDSGILPCRVYLRHCILAVQKLGKVQLTYKDTFTSIKQEVEEDFMINSYLGDRQTTIKDYVAKHPDIMNAVPPATLVGRYSG
ncbi:unnamed protein product [Aphanomyces euteiches]